MVHIGPKYEEPKARPKDLVLVGVMQGLLKLDYFDGDGAYMVARWSSNSELLFPQNQAELAKYASSPGLYTQGELVLSPVSYPATLDQQLVVVELCQITFLPSGVAAIVKQGDRLGELELPIGRLSHPDQNSGVEKLALEISQSQIPRRYTPQFVSMTGP